MLTFKNYNIADWFSFYRIAMVPVLFALILMEERQIFTWLLLVSYSTDAIDGLFGAKAKNLQS